MRGSPFTSGFTLMETVIYVALLGLLLTGAIVAAFSLASGSERNARALEIGKEALFLEEKIGWTLKNVESVSVSAEGDTFIVHRTPGEDFSAAENPVTFFLDDGLLMMQRGSAPPVALNARRISIAAFEARSETRGSRRYIDVFVRIDEKSFDFRYSITL